MQSDLLRSKGLQAFLSFLTHPSAGSSHRPQCCMGPQLLCSPEAREKLQGCSPKSLGVSSPPTPTAAPTSSSWTQGPMRNVAVMSLDGTDELTGLCLHHSHSPGATHTAGEETDKASQIPLKHLFGLIPIDLGVPRLAACLSGCSKAFLALRLVTVRKESTQKWGNSFSLKENSFLSLFCSHLVNFLTRIASLLLFYNTQPIQL